MKLTIKILLVVFCFFLTITYSHAQLLNDTTMQAQIKQAIDKIYNFEFAAAEPMIASIRKSYPQHPVSSLLMALFTSWKNFPMDPKTEAYQAYQSYLTETLNRTNKLFENDKNNPEGVFFALSAHSYQGLIASEDKEYMKALGEAKKAYNYLRKGFDYVEQYPEFYFTTGLYNYYVVQYPQDHSIIKPFMFFFSSGDKALGLKQMETSIQKGIFTRTEAQYWLMHIYLKHEVKPKRAAVFAETLVKKYPNNILYVMRYTEALIASGQYDVALPFIKQLMAHKHKAFQSAAYVFQGVILEKQANNQAQARAHYHHALDLATSDKRYTNEYYAMAYAGLARISDREGNKENARSYYKKALEMAEYQATIQEAKGYLKNA
jgi:tetratricopeptide (TPR) repeat protein